MHVHMFKYVCIHIGTYIPPNELEDHSEIFFGTNFGNFSLGEKVGIRTKRGSILMFCNKTLAINCVYFERL